jgi:hypothetical protein
MGDVVPMPTNFDPWLTKAALGRALGGYSLRWVECRLADGMPSRLEGGQRKFLLSEARAWLAVNGWPQLGP